MKRLFHGTGTALSTPFNQDGSVDFESFGRLIDYQIENGVEALVPCGSTGESATLTLEEKVEVIRFTVERAKKVGAYAPQVIAGTGSNVTAATIELTQEARNLGVHGALLVSPYYNKPSQRGIAAHYGAIAEAVPDLPLLLYNVPGRTGSNITAQTTLDLAREYENILGTKEASGDFEQCCAIIRDAPEGFEVYSGEDSLTLPLLALGAKGVIAVVGNEAPKEFGDMVRYCLAGKYEEAKEIHMKLFDLMLLNFVESNPTPVKAALHIMGIFDSAYYRLPLTGLAEENREKFRAVLTTLGLTKQQMQHRQQIV